VEGNEGANLFAEGECIKRKRVLKNNARKFLTSTFTAELHQRKAQCSQNTFYRETTAMLEKHHLGIGVQK